VLALLADFELSEQVRDLVLVEAREGEVDVKRRLEVSNQTGQELLVPGPADLVQRQPQEPCLFRGNVEPRHWDCGEPESAGRDQPLVTTDNRAVLASGEHRLDEAELAQAALEGVEFVLADPAGGWRDRAGCRRSGLARR
jgi:hypothetical protein